MPEKFTSLFPRRSHFFCTPLVTKFEIVNKMNFGLKCYFVWLKYDKNQARYEKSGEDWTKRTLIAKIYPFYKPFIVRNILYKRLCVDNFKYLIYD